MYLLLTGDPGRINHHTKSVYFCCIVGDLAVSTGRTCCILMDILYQVCKEIPYEKCHPVPEKVAKQIPKKVSHQVCEDYGYGGHSYGYDRSDVEAEEELEIV